MIVTFWFLDYSERNCWYLGVLNWCHQKEILKLSCPPDFLTNIETDTAWKVSVFGDFLVLIFPHSDWIRSISPYSVNTEYISVFSPNAGKYGPEKLRIRTLFTQFQIWANKRLKMNHHLNTLCKIPKFHLISLCGNFVERHGFCIVSGW